MKAAISCWSKTRVRALHSAGGSLSSWKPIRPSATVNDRQLPLALLQVDFTYCPLATASYCVSSSEGYGLGVRATGSQLLHDCADHVLASKVYVHCRTGWRSSEMRCAVSLTVVLAEPLLAAPAGTGGSPPAPRSFQRLKLEPTRLY